MKAYKYRISDEMLLRKLAGKGAVLIDGPKWCGKTTTAKRIAKSTLMLGKTSVLLNTLDALDVAPEQILLGAVPRLFDEWQTIPEIWDMIRSEVDERGEPGQFILTGSSVLPEAYKTVIGTIFDYGSVEIHHHNLTVSRTVHITEFSEKTFCFVTAVTVLSE